ncbi:phosphatase PAP2 family protein [Nonomuraea bangladeshensis]|uniref:phosphatase PAP2 family protein n=1 Tax=Nonomuraea bangladeshensis TaxID=404385 RepID=UPI003C2EB432
MTEVFAPKHFVIGLPLVVGAVTGGWAGLGWAAVAAALCGGVPAAVIALGVRSGRFGNQHITDRAQRPALIAVIAGLVVAALALLVVLGAPRVMVACVAVMLATLAVLGPITVAGWKISFHTAVAAGSFVMLAAVVPAGWAGVVAVAGAAVVALIGWSRAVLGDHTPGQVLAGAAAGAGATWATLAVLL